MTRILGIEDQDAKWKRVHALMLKAMPTSSIERAKDMFEGERMVEEGMWDLVILDISLDIRSAGKGRNAQDYLGGLEIAGHMYYEDCSIPTIIVTGFDSYPSGGAAHEQNVILGSEDVQRRARDFLGDDFLGAVRYNAPGWDEEFLQLLKDFDAR